MKVRADLGGFLLRSISMLLVSLSATYAVGADWTHWRGPSQDGVARGTHSITDWSPDGRNVLWQVPIGGRATPIVLDGRLYMNCVTRHDPNDADARIDLQEQVVCWNAETGDELWRDRFNVFQTDISAERVGWASMAGDAETGLVYMHSVSGLFRCYNAAGDVVWEHSLHEEFGKISGYGGRTQTPIVDENRVIVSFLTINWGDTGRPPAKHTYYAFDKRTGELLWVSAPGGRPHDTNFSAPLVRVIDGVRMLVAGNADGGCYAIHARTGDKLWGFRLSKRGINVSPVIAGQHVFIAHGEDNIDNLEFGRVQCIDATGRGDITATHGVWRVDGVKAGTASLLVHDGILYVVADTGVLHAFRSRDGSRLWTHSLGTMGFGSPVWANGKIYVTEVHGNVHVLRVNSEGCETLSHVSLRNSQGGASTDIFASPVINDGRFYLVTGDRTYCLGAKPSAVRIPATSAGGSHQAAEAEANAEDVSRLQLVPYEVAFTAGDAVDFKLQAFDAGGRHVGESLAPIQLSEGLTASAMGHRLHTSVDAAESSGTVHIEQSGLLATARVRIFPRLPWVWDFDGAESRPVPSTWIRGFKLQAADVDGSTALVCRPGPGRPSNYIWLGKPEMRGYTIQSDVMVREQRRRMPNIGLSAQRYNLILKGNTGRLGIESWAAQQRMATDLAYSWEPDVWYTIKLRVDAVDGSYDNGAIVRGKVWRRNDVEPEDWTIEATDPHPNRNGSPGLYTYTLADCYFDNLSVVETKP